MPSHFTKPLSAQEHVVLSSALNSYLTAQFKSEELTIDNVVVHLNSDVTIQNFKLIFGNIPAIRALVDESPKKDKYLDINAEDIRSLLRDLTIDQVLSSSLRLCPKIKARFLIYVLEAIGHYERPPEMGEDSLFFTVKREIFNDPLYEEDLFPANFEGDYLLHRLSLNSSFPDQMTSNFIRIKKGFIEKNRKSDPDEVIFRYESVNRYEQDIDGVPIIRTRTSKGYVFHYQRNLLFVGRVEYSHLADAENDQVLREQAPFDFYPEIMFCHAHGGDRNTVRGIMLAHFPFLGLPVATRVVLSKQVETGSSMNFELLKSQYKMLGNHEEGSVVFSDDPSKYKRIFKMIRNDIESTYSHMLTP